jgi:hypothetical protein
VDMGKMRVSRMNATNGVDIDQKWLPWDCSRAP